MYTCYRSFQNLGSCDHRFVDVNKYFMECLGFINGREFNFLHRLIVDFHQAIQFIQKIFVVEIGEQLLGVMELAAGSILLMVTSLEDFS